MVGSILDERFALYEGGRTISAAELLLQAKEQLGTHDQNACVYINEQGVSGLITALVANQDRKSDLYIMRDTSSRPDVTDGGDGKIWLQTSGTTGKPKWIAHSVGSLTSKIAAGNGDRARWLLSFNAGSFAGLQVVLSAMIGGHDLVVALGGSTIAELARLAVVKKVTHISGTPTFWRAFLMALDDVPLDLKCVTLGGEPADQPILDALYRRFPRAALRHIYATTEAGVIFSVGDGRAGFPRLLLDEGVNGTRLSISADRTLIVHNPQAGDFAHENAWDTKDVVDVAEDRVFFKGRLDSMVNVGGVKVYPEEVEAFILELPFVQEIKVGSRPNPITGNILVADVIVKSFAGDAQTAIRAHLSALPRTHRPVSFRFVDRLDLGATGKKARVSTRAGE